MHNQATSFFPLTTFTVEQSKKAKIDLEAKKCVFYSKFVFAKEVGLTCEIGAYGMSGKNSTFGSRPITCSMTRQRCLTT